jgi:hypothetical protein
MTIFVRGIVLGPVFGYWLECLGLLFFLVFFHKALRVLRRFFLFLQYSRFYHDPHLL